MGSEDLKFFSWCSIINQDMFFFRRLGYYPYAQRANIYSLPMHCMQAVGGRGWTQGDNSKKSLGLYQYYIFPLPGTAVLGIPSTAVPGSALLAGRNIKVPST